MRLLLDTHVILWWVDDDPRLGERRRDAILQPSSDVLFSVGSLWEIAIKMKAGKLRADLGDIENALAADRFGCLAISVDHLETLIDLPRHHRDPFDRLLIAQAISEGATLVSADHAMTQYAVDLL